MTPSTTSTLYFRPTAFIDAPFGLDGQFARLAGGMQFFSAWDVVAVDGGVRSEKWLIPIDRIEGFIATSPRSASLQRPSSLLKVGFCRGCGPEGKS